MKKAWIYVFLTCLFELFWVYGFNVATIWWHWAVVGVIIIADFYFLSKGCETLPTGTVYAIFAAAGTVGTALMDIFIFGGFGSSFAFLYAALNYLQLSVAYAVWIGIGTAGAVLVNMIFFNESKSIGRIISLIIIVVGVTGLKAVS
ncbi:DMT family transporter [Paenibacillus sp. OSY-SE]|uniref:DMT family transporter n=1 Tax=Paenibacillus sp. OSY-SE TaxID=1196323 RepID=UPI00036529EF|nr:SMR family transporter [Paenibacillus sp. OSY-SE]